MILTALSVSLHKIQQEWSFGLRAVTNSRPFCTAFRVQKCHQVLLNTSAQTNGRGGHFHCCRVSGEYLALKLNSPRLFGVFFTSSGDALSLSRLVNFLTEFFGALRRFVLSFYYFTLQSFPCFINDHKFSSFTRDQKWGQRFHRKAASLKDGNGAFYSKTCGSNV